MVEVESTIGQIREEVNKREKQGNAFPGGMTKAQYLQYRLNTCLAEGDGYDLIVMGRSRGGRLLLLRKWNIKRAN